MQDLLGVDEGDAGPRPGGASVRYELQADCLAAAYAASRDDGVPQQAYLDVVRESGDDVGDEPLPRGGVRARHGGAAAGCVPPGPRLRGAGLRAALLAARRERGGSAGPDAVAALVVRQLHEPEVREQRREVHPEAPR